MKFKNKQTNTIIEVNDKDIERIKKLEGYPDKFEKVVVDLEEEPKVTKTKEQEPSKKEKEEKQDK